MRKKNDTNQTVKAINIDIRQIPKKIETKSQTYLFLLK